ncbi:C-type lectin-like IEV [Cetacean poxvirus 1]|nr:C-type lectin-like IEV [Cetacean poxvirus 1]
MSNTFNKQTSQKIKKALVPSTIVVTILTVLSGIYTGLKYASNLFPTSNFCNDEKWLQYDNVCLYDSGYSTSELEAHIFCDNLKSTLVSVTNMKHVNVVTLTFEKNFWVTNKYRLLTKTEEGYNITVSNINSEEEYDEDDINSHNGCMVVNKNNLELLQMCDNSFYVICMKQIQ